MSAARNPFAYSRIIRLAPAIGDWTTIQYRGDLDDTQINSIQNIGFNGLPKERLRVAHLLHYRIAEQVVQKLSTDMDLNVELFTVSAAQMSFADFWRQYSDNFVQTHLTLPAFGTAHLMLEWGLADCMVNRLTGGDGEESQHIEFSSIEHAVLQTEIHQLLGVFSQIWGNLFPPDVLQPRFFSGPIKDDGKRSSREAVTVFSCQISFGKSELRRLYWVYPSAVLRTLLQAKAQRPEHLPSQISLHRRTLQSIKTEVKATVGRSTLTMNELRGLQTGDVIPLDTRLVAPLELVLGTTTNFNVQAGISHHRYCVQLIFMDATESPTVAFSPPPPVPEPMAATPIIPEPAEPLMPPPAPTPAYVAPAPLPAEDLFEEHFEETPLPIEEPNEWDAGYVAPAATPEPEEDAFEFEDDDEEDDEEDLEPQDSEDPESEDHDDELLFEDEEEAAPQAAEQPPVQDFFPGETPETSAHDDDLSWDSLDDHF